MKFELQYLAEYSRASIIAELQRVAGIITHKFITTTEFEQHARIHVRTLWKYFGSWRNALRQAGLEHRLNRTARYKTNRELLIELRRMAHKKELGRSRYGTWSRLGLFHAACCFVVSVHGPRPLRPRI